MPATANPLSRLYNDLKRLGNADLKSPRVTDALVHLCELSLDYIRQHTKMSQLTSRVTGKRYMMAVLNSGAKSSRPINSDLFDIRIARSDMESLMSGNTDNFGEQRLQQVLYTTALSFCIATDVISVGNRKSPGTFFETLVGHLAAIKFGVNPSKTIAIPSLDIENTLPTDLIFDLGTGRAKVHMPVKISTRERVVQAWAHQRVLEGMHGTGRFRGILVILTETNKQKDISVVEVCLPGQWAAYQMYISAMYRVYYFDLPKAYEPLKDRYPFIPVWPFSRFFTEYATIRSPPAT